MEPSFFKRHRVALILILLAVILIAFAIARRSQAPETTTSNTPPPPTGNARTSTPPPPPTAEGSETEPGNQGSGTDSSENLSSEPGLLEYRTTLHASTDPAKGNYFVTINGSTIYITTGRDYSHLVGKEVVFKASGNIEDFSLLSITEAE